MNQAELEQQWKDGSHVTSKGAVVQLDQMSFPQLQNTLNKYSSMGYDTTPLKNEIERRPAAAPTGNQDIEGAGANDQNQ